MKSIKSAITIIALVATAFSYGQASAERITVEMESVRQDSVESLYQYKLLILNGSRFTEGLPEIQSVAGLDIDAPLHARLSFEDSQAEPIVIVGQDDDGQDIAFVVADSTAQPQQLQLTDSKQIITQEKILRAELTVPSAGQAPEFKIELYIARTEWFDMNSRWDYVHYRPLELRLGEAEIGGQLYIIAIVRSPFFGTYSLPDDSLSVDSSEFPNHRLLIDLNGNGEFDIFLTGPAELEREIFGIKDPFLINNQLYKLADVSATGDRLVIERSEQEVALAEGFEMPNVAVTRLDGSTIDLTALRGKPVVLNWWHTACSPCIAEIPELNKLVEKYEGRDVEFLAIANNEIADLPPFLKRHPFAYDIALGDEEAMRILGQIYPRHVIIDGDGKVVLDINSGSSDVIDQIDSVISSLLVSEL